MKVGIFVICYNAHNIFLKQMERINRHCKDNFEVIIIDNSTNQESIEAIKYYCEKIGLEIVKTNASSQNGSGSHSFAANLSYQLYKDKFDSFAYFDHDLFPIKDFSVIEILGDKELAGIGQLKKGVTYLWPGCLMFKKGLDVDFSPSHELGLDTGGGLHKIITPDNTVHFNESYEQNPEFSGSFYNAYSLINNEMFMHFINGSGWNKVGNNEERINSLLNVLDKK